MPDLWGLPRIPVMAFLMEAGSMVQMDLLVKGLGLGMRGLPRIPVMAFLMEAVSSSNT